MKSVRLLIIIFILVVLVGCQDFEPGKETVDGNPTPELILTPTPTPVPTPPPHSGLYIDGLSVEDVIAYFNEVCLDAEFVNSGDPSRVQKWGSAIYYKIIGDFTQADLDKINEFCSWLNGIEGFPGIYETEDFNSSNLRIYFGDQQYMLDVMGDQYSNMDGAVTFWYEYDVIYDANIFYRSDIDQYLRNSVILEEIYNGLGPIQDTELRTDSIIYANFSQPQELTEIDALLLRLLYHPSIQCGMNASQCETVIRQLYY